MANPLLSDREVAFQLYEVLEAEQLTRLPYFSAHGRDTFDAYLGACARFAREVLFPSYRELDQAPPELRDGRVTAHPKLHALLPRLRELGVTSATRPAGLGGQQLPLTVATAATLYLMAGNAAAYGYLGLTTGAAHLVETFANRELRDLYLAPLYEGRWLGTMALTEPQAGSSLADVSTRATPAGESYKLSGAKLFISGGDHDLSENIVHMVLARIDGAPPGLKGVSLFLVPKLRPEGGGLVPNDVSVTGLIHKIGWRALPSLALAFGERGDCRGWLVGAPHRGIHSMFQMMNEARIMVGANGVATASVALHESVAYARDRTQGRPLENKDPAAPPVPIIEHADVRRMLLRQKAIVEGGMALVLATARYADLAEHAEDAILRERARMLLDLLTPIAKSFPAEFGFEANALAVQVHGGYGYSSEYLPEAWLRDQKLNSIHEGTTGIQAMDLLGRKVHARGGDALLALREEISAACVRARKAGLDEAWIEALEQTSDQIGILTMHLGGLGITGEVDAMMRHATDYLQAACITVVAWQLLLHAAVAAEALAARQAPQDFYQAKLLTAQYWLRTELPKVPPLLELCRTGEDSYTRMRPDWF